MNRIIRLFKDIKASRRIMKDPYEELIRRVKEQCAYLNDRVDGENNESILMKILLEEDLQELQRNFLYVNIIHKKGISIIDLLVVMNWFVYCNAMMNKGTTSLPKDSSFYNQYYFPIRTFLEGNKNIFKNLVKYTSYSESYIYSNDN